MNYRVIFRLMGTILLIVAAFMLPSLGIAFVSKEYNALLAFVITIAVVCVIGIPLSLIRIKNKTIRAREGFVVVVLAWVLLSAAGALPFYLSGEIPSYVDSFFESVSGFTTTGASILSNVEVMSKSLLFWRSFTHWLGGMGVLVFMLAIMPMAKGNGESLLIMRAESTGPQVDKLVPRTGKSAQILYAIYLVLTVLQIIFLLLGDMPLFDAVTTAFGTAGTGGFGIKNTSLTDYSPYVQYVVAVFMFLFGINFSLFYLILLGGVSKALRNEELHLYVGLVLGSTLLICVNLYSTYAQNAEMVFRHSFFQVVSVVTTTGFSTQDFNLWPQLSKTILVCLMIPGACAGSTAGGMKCSRILILYKGIILQLRKLLHPNQVSFVRINQEVIPSETVQGVYAYSAAYFLIAVVTILFLSLDGFSLETNFTSMLACLSNIGPGLDVVGPSGNYSAFSAFSKLLLSLDMLLGRLEIFPFLICFFPSTWKRAR